MVGRTGDGSRSEPENRTEDRNRRPTSSRERHTTASRARTARGHESDNHGTTQQQRRSDQRPTSGHSQRTPSASPAQQSLYFAVRERQTLTRERPPNVMPDIHAFQTRGAVIARKFDHDAAYRLREREAGIRLPTSTHPITARNESAAWRDAPTGAGPGTPTTDRLASRHGRHRAQGLRTDAAQQPPTSPPHATSAVSHRETGRAHVLLKMPCRQGITKCRGFDP